jgi:hypothetical protein
MAGETADLLRKPLELTLALGMGCTGQNRYTRRRERLF